MKVLSFIYCPAYQPGLGDGYIGKLEVEVSGKRLCACKTYDRYYGVLPFKHVQRELQYLIMCEIQKELFE